MTDPAESETPPPAPPAHDTSAPPPPDWSRCNALEADHQRRMDSLADQIRSTERKLRALRFARGLSPRRMVRCAKLGSGPVRVVSTEPDEVEGVKIVVESDDGTKHAVSPEELMI